MEATTVGVDLAKNVFGVHAVDSRGAVVVRKMIVRRHLLKFFASLPPCLVGMEACNSSHYWAREIAKHGHQVRLMSPQFVKPYRKTNKNDQNDAEAICEAVGRPSMRFVPVKSPAQQDLQAVHRVREQLLKTRTALANQMRALLRERGVAIPLGIGRLRKALPAVLADREELLSGMFKELLIEMAERLRELDERITRYDRRIAQLFQSDERCERLGQIEGVGPLAATALVAAVGNACEFKSARQFSAWLGLVPRQHSSGDKKLLLGISKRGDRYLRKLLIQGARCALGWSARKRDVRSLWACRIKAKRGTNVAAVALANKNARIVWALLARGQTYRPAAPFRDRSAA